MTTRRAPSRHRHAALLLTGALAVTLAGCSGSSGGDSTTTADPTAAPSTTAASPSSTPTPVCADQVLSALTDDQRLGQLIMVGFDTNAARGSLDTLITEQHVGNVIYLGGWDGAEKVKSTSTHLQGLVSETATAGLGLLIAADQEGGEVHQLRGKGFTQPPSASTQATMAPDALTKAATGWAKEMKAAGVNVNLAPVADTVPESMGTKNGPIGKYHREYGSDPEGVATSVTAFIKGMLAGDVEPTVKHFPGLGRIRNNTDFSSTGITDDTTTVDDPYLKPFVAGIDAGAGLVMVGSARYSKIDPDVPAMFSAPIVTDLLRGELGFDGVVITDAVNAEAVKATKPADRAVKVIAAGGDIVLTGDAGTVPAMLAALRSKVAADPEFADQVQSSVERVLTLKDRMGLLPCSSGADD